MAAIRQPFEWNAFSVPGVLAVYPTIPEEALPNVGAYLLLGLSNDDFGYLLVKEDFSAFPRCDYISRTSLGERTGPIFVKEALALIKEAEQKH